MLLTPTPASKFCLLGCCGAIALSLTIMPPQAAAINSLPSQKIELVNNSQYLSDNLSQTRKKTEFLDNDTEKIILRHKSWFLFGFIVFVWMGYQSLTIKHK